MHFDATIIETDTWQTPSATPPLKRLYSHRWVSTLFSSGESTTKKKIGDRRTKRWNSSGEILRILGMKHKYGPTCCTVSGLWKKVSSGSRTPALLWSSVITTWHHIEISQVTIAICQVSTLKKETNRFKMTPDSTTTTPRPGLFLASLWNFDLRTIELTITLRNWETELRWTNTIMSWHLLDAISSSKKLWSTSR